MDQSKHAFDMIKKFTSGKSLIESQVEDTGNDGESLVRFAWRKINDAIYGLPLRKVVVS